MWFSIFKIKELLFKFPLKSLPPKIKILFLSKVIEQEVSKPKKQKPGSFGLNKIQLFKELILINSIVLIVSKLFFL